MNRRTFPENPHMRGKSHFSVLSEENNVLIFFSKVRTVYKGSMIGQIIIMYMVYTEKIIGLACASDNECIENTKRVNQCDATKNRDDTTADGSTYHESILRYTLR